MQTDYRAVLETTDKISQAKTPEQAFELLTDYGASVGFDYFFAGNLSMELTAVHKAPPFFMHKTPDGWEDMYLSNGYMHVDPAVQMSATLSRAFRWSECYEDATPEQLRYRSELGALGLNHGLVYPMHHTIGAVGAVAFVSERDFTLAPIVKTHLEIVARCAYEKLEALIGPPEAVEVVKLTERERAILTLVAQGKTNWEVGKILEFSEYSVRDYLKQMSSRLNTSNRTHTVTRAIQMGLISP